MPEPEVPERAVAVPQSATVVRLYDVAIGHIVAAAEHANVGDFQQQLDNVLAANRIFNGLDGCLDMEKGGAVAANLRDMYQSVARALLSSVGQPNGSETCQTLLIGLRETRDAWAEIAGLPKASAV